jgi:hypothetical protein
LLIEALGQGLKLFDRGGDLGRFADEQQALSFESEKLKKILTDGKLAGVEEVRPLKRTETGLEG